MPGLIQIFDVASDAGIKNALDLALQWHGKVSRFKNCEQDTGLPALYLGDVWLKEANELPASLDASQITPFVLAWLEEQKDHYGRQPDCDGHCTKGWRIRSTYEGLMITPHWIEYHK